MQIKAAKTNYIMSTILGTFALIIGCFFITGLFLADGNEKAAAISSFLSFIFILIYVLYLCKNEGKRAEDFVKDEQTLNQLSECIIMKENEIHEYEQRKKEMILQKERELSDNMEEKITDEFSFDTLDDIKECPMCAETVRARAKKCRYCGYEFE